MEPKVRFPKLKPLKRPPFLSLSNMLGEFAKEIPCVGEGTEAGADWRALDGELKVNVSGAFGLLKVNEVDVETAVASGFASEVVSPSLCLAEATDEPSPNPGVKDVEEPKPKPDGVGLVSDVVVQGPIEAAVAIDDANIGTTSGEVAGLVSVDATGELQVKLNGFFSVPGEPTEGGVTKLKPEGGGLPIFEV